MEQGILDTLYQVLRAPADGLREVTRGRPLGWAILLVVILSAVWVATHISGSFDLLRGFFSLGGGMSSILVTLLWIVISVGGLFFTSAIFHLIAIILRGRGSYSGIVCGLGFANLPIAFIAPLALLYALFNTPGFILYSLGSIVIGVWILVLEIIAIRENYNFSYGRAIATYFTPVVIMILVPLLALAVSFLAQLV
jgi:hypothetical protein